MTSLQDFALPIHKSLQQPDLLLGVPKQVFAIIICLTLVLVYMLGFLFIFSGVIFYAPCYLLSRDDPDLLTIALDSLSQADFLEG
jgi:type IV secretory pathway VirB3-like protein